MDDVFLDAMRQVGREAPPELVNGFRDKMRAIQGQYKHTETTVQSCLDGLSETPTLMELLTAAFVVNGGVLFKYDLDPEDTEHEFTSFIKEMEAGLEEPG
jgi:hypothetical protein